MVCNKLRRCIAELSRTPQRLDPTCRLRCSKGVVTDSNPKFEENKKSVVFQNPNGREVICYCVDGGMVDDTTIEKCDGLFIALEPLHKAVFIELKGSNIKKAISQIGSTVELYKKDLKDFRQHGRIICSSATPRLHNEPYYMKLAKYFRDNGGSLLVKEKRHVESVESL